MRISNIAVLGAGTMGHGIAQVGARAGYQVRLYDVLKKYVAGGLARIAANLKAGIERDKVTADERQRTMAAISGSTDESVVRRQQRQAYDGASFPLSELPR